MQFFTWMFSSKPRNPTSNVLFSNFHLMSKPNLEIYIIVTLLERSISRSSRSGLFVLFIARSFKSAAMQGMIIFPELNSVQV